MRTPPSYASRLAHADAERLARAWHDHRDVGARNRLVLSYAPMVKYLATRKIRQLPSHCDLDDLVSCGLLALIGAIDRFDPSKGVTLENYAWTRVTGAILDELRRQDWAPRSLRRMGRAIELARTQWFERTGCWPTDNELATTVEISVEDLRGYQDSLAHADLTSLDAPATGVDDETPVCLADTVEAPAGMDNPEAALLSGDRAQMLRQAIASLPEREQRVLKMTYIDHMSGDMIGKALGVSPSRVSQLISRSRSALRVRVEAYEHESRTGLATARVDARLPQGLAR